MNRAKAVTLLKSGSDGIKEWNGWRANRTFELVPVVLRSDFREVNLEFADLMRVNLSDADLSHARLKGANLTGANLARADLCGADLRDAILKTTDLRDANLRGAQLQGAYLAGAHSGGTIWASTDLTEVKKLEEIVHHSPSTIGFDTLLLSHNLSTEFLSGCGVPETLVEHAKSLANVLEPIQFYSCFISYTHIDSEFAQRLHGRLRQEGLGVWYAPEELQGGKKLDRQIDEAIRLHDKVLLVLSESSMSSEWVATEIYKARQREEKEQRQVLFPIRLVDFERIKDWECFDADTGKDMAREIREYFIPDFSEWKEHDKFEAAFARLLADLKKSAEPATK